MNTCFLESSVAIGIVFRHEAERKAMTESFNGLHPTTSNYVLFEIARGFLRRLIALHNQSYDFKLVNDLHMFVSTGSGRFTRELATWANAIMDYQATMEENRQPADLDEFRAILRVSIRRGWRALKKMTLLNPTKCRADLPPPVLKDNLLLVHQLPVEQCGNPTICGVQSFIQKERADVDKIIEALKALPAGQKKESETKKRLADLPVMLATPVGQKFLGKQCYNCGDAVICLECPPDSAVITKNGKHFIPMADAIGKHCIVAKGARCYSDEKEISS